MGNALNRLSRLEAAVGITAGLALLSLFIPWYHISGVGSQSFSAWDTGYGWIGDLLVVVAGAYVVLNRSRANGAAMLLRPTVIVLGASALGTVLVMMRLGSLPKASSQSVAGIVVESNGPSAGIVIALLVGIAQSVLVFLMLRAVRKGSKAVVAAEPGGA
jgi:hypothetical protein